MTAKKGRVFNHILIATDGSAISNKAARAGIALAKALGARVTAYYAVDAIQPLYVEGGVVDPNIMRNVEALAKAAGQKRVDKIAKIAKAAGVRFDVLVKKARTAYEGIIDAAKRQRCDAIVMASHGRRGLEAHDG